MGIENIHTMRNSFARLFALCRTVARDAAPGYWLSSLECTRWLDHVRLLLSSAARCAELLQQGSAVLVHCSDGWDRTAQVRPLRARLTQPPRARADTDARRAAPQLSSLTQLLLDPYFRTIKGFAVLVEKEWCAFGHMFDQRCGHRCVGAAARAFSWLSTAARLQRPAVLAARAVLPRVPAVRGRRVAAHDAVPGRV